MDKIAIRYRIKIEKKWGSFEDCYICEKAETCVGLLKKVQRCEEFISSGSYHEKEFETKEELMKFLEKNQDN